MNESVYYYYVSYISLFAYQIFFFLKTSVTP